MSIAAQINGGNSAYGRIASDFYPTPPEPVIALLRFLNLKEGTTIWEPACGQGDMVRVLEGAGMKVIATDILTGNDFLNEGDRGEGWIITNPPFSVADKFIEHCIETGKPFALLLKSQYWHAKKRQGLFKMCPPSFVLPITWRVDFLKKKRGAGSPVMDCIWTVWLPGQHDTRYIPLEKPL